MSIVSSFQNLSVRTKVVAAFVSVTLATAGLGVFSIDRAGQINTSTVQLQTEDLPSIQYVVDMQYLMLKYRQKEAAYLLTNERERASKLDDMHDAVAKVRDLRAKYEPTITPGAERALANAMDSSWAAYLAMEAKLIATADAKDTAGAAELYATPMKTAFESVEAAVSKDEKFQIDGAAQTATESTDNYNSAKLWITVALGVTALLAALAGFALISAVSTPLKNMTGALKDLADGNLNVHVPAMGRKDEIGALADVMTNFKGQLAAADRAKAEQTSMIELVGVSMATLASGDLTHRAPEELTGAFTKLKNDFNGAMARLQDTMKNVLSSTSGISTGAGEIAQAADDLSRRTEQNAASLEETAAALEEITATVKKTATNAREANKIVTGAKTAAEEGGRVVETAITAMGEIEQSSKKITDIIGVIDEIAFQTNLLALNAGVEAARAGDAGKGFAVVASEVRALAQRSSEAAREIKTLIKTSGEQVNSGVKLVDESGKALKRIVEQVVQIDTLVSEMAQAAQQQSTGIEEVNVAVSQMDQVTQQNAAMVEQSTAASRNLATETAELSDIVSLFNVGDSKSPSRKAAAPASPTAGRVASHAVPKAPVKTVASGGRRAATALAQRPAPQPEAEDWQEF